MKGWYLALSACSAREAGRGGFLLGCLTGDGWWINLRSGGTTRCFRSSKLTRRNGKEGAARLSDRLPQRRAGKEINPVANTTLLIV